MPHLIKERIKSAIEKPYMLVIAAVFTMAVLLWQNVIQLRAEEPRRAAVALEIHLSNEFIVPHICGWPYYNKPPLFNWLIVGCYRIFNSYDEWVVRLPSTISAILLAIFTFLVARKFVDKETAVLSGFFVVLSSEPLLYGLVTAGELDYFFALSVFLQMITIFTFFEKKQFWLLFIISYAITGISFLTKGMPALVFQALTLLGVFAYNKRVLNLISLPHITGIIILSVIIGGYYFLFDQKDDAMALYSRQFQEASAKTLLESSWRNILWWIGYFPVSVLNMLLPWSLFILFTFKKTYWNKLFANRFLVFCIIFISANILIYWSSGDFRARYIYPFIPFFAPVLAYAWVSMRDELKIVRKIITNIFASLIFLTPAALPFVLFISEVQTLNFVWLRFLIPFLLALMIMIFYVYTRKKPYALTVLMLFFMINIRLISNLIYLPTYQKNGERLYYRREIGKILAITKQEKIYYLDEPHREVATAKLGPFKFREVEIKTSPYMAFQFPYYITRHNEKVFQYVIKPIPGALHIAPKSLDLIKGQDILFEIRDRAADKQKVLFRYVTPP